MCQNLRKFWGKKLKIRLGSFQTWCKNTTSAGPAGLCFSCGGGAVRSCRDPASKEIKIGFILLYIFAYGLPDNAIEAEHVEGVA